MAFTFYDYYSVKYASLSDSEKKEVRRKAKRFFQKNPNALPKNNALPKRSVDQIQKEITHLKNNAFSFAAWSLLSDGAVIGFLSYGFIHLFAGGDLAEVCLSVGGGAAIALFYGIFMYGMNESLGQTTRNLLIEKEIAEVARKVG